jgi:aspartyl protease family protein
MDNDIIQCPRCDTDNPVASDICYVCGQALHEQQTDKDGKHWLMGLLILIAAGIGAFFLYNQFPRESPPPIVSQVVPATPLTPPAEKTDGSVKSDSVPAPPKTKEPLTQGRSAGSVIINNTAEKTIARIPAAIVADGWIALPKQSCLGGSQWLFQTAAGKELSILEGIIAENDKLGIWRIQNDDMSLKGPELRPWAEGQELMWTSLKADAVAKPVEINVSDRQTHFAGATLSPEISEPGILIQDDHVVGWTFGSALKGAFVWIGSPGAELKAAIRVEDYYRATFANSREEELTLALALDDDYTQLERLAAVANAFRFAPKLAMENTPPDLKPDAVIPKLQTLTAQAVRDGYALDVAGIFDAQILIQVADINLVAEVLKATVEGYDFEEAAELAEDISQRISLTESQAKIQFAELRSGLYQNWITSALDQGDIQDGWHAYELGSQQLPNDLKIHLLGVRLALAQNDWAKAERLLGQKDYPTSLADQVSILQARISELKGQEGKIVIQFTPGSQVIQVSATLDQTVEQRFIVDTGASTVTIPSATAERLGIDLDSDFPVRSVTTAAGIIEAPEVVLPSIKLDDWEVADITALVIDIPNQPDLGLLGLNFLERFRMDLNTEKGILILEPR